LLGAKKGREDPPAKNLKDCDPIHSGSQGLFYFVPRFGLDSFHYGKKGLVERSKYGKRKEGGNEGARI
jgi:hypothetical protein